MSNFIVDIAVDIAFRAHQGQFRNDGIVPYIVHPIAVMNQIMSWGIKRPSMLAAAALHDALEDTHLSAEAIESSFGDDGDTVLRLVLSLTLESCPPEQKVYAKQEYMKSFVGKSTSALVLKIADRICNVKDFLAEGDPYATKYYAQAEPLWDALRDRHHDIVLEFGQPTLHNLLKSHTQLMANLNLA